MTFDKLLDGILDKVHGARGVVFLAQDGEIVYQCAQRKVTNLDLLAAYQGITMTTCQRFADDFGIGHISTVILNYEAGACVLKLLNEGYILMVSLDADGNIGQTMHLVNSVTDQLNAEIGY